MSSKNIYLFVYNIIACCGWAYVLYLSIQSGWSHSFWTNVGPTLVVVQSLALLEVFHSILKLVPSPFQTTLLQVSSRLFIVWAVTPHSLTAQHNWSLYLMVLSWSLVEVPRYLFYAINLFSPVPFPLVWLRYSLFIVLYPTGISGEILQIWNSMHDFKAVSLPLWYLFGIAILAYIPGSPIMYFHMVGQRKRAFEKTGAPAPRAAAPPPPNGLEFPNDPHTGQPSSTIINKGAFAASVKGVDPEEAKRIDNEKNWRFKYYRYVIRNVELCATKPKNCIQICENGLDYLHENFNFFREGKCMSFISAMTNIKGTFETGFLKGKKEKPSSFKYVVPYKNKNLTGEELINQLNQWVAYGTIETEARDAIEAVTKNENWLDLSDQYFVLLGAGSAMGPLHVLLSLGANVIAIDLDRENIWKDLISLTEKSCGTIHFPLKKPQHLQDNAELAKNAGCNLFTQTPEIRNWISSLVPGKPLVVGGYAYLDGALHVKVALAMDAIMKGLCEDRPNVTLAFLCTPTDVHVITEGAYQAQKKNYEEVPWWQRLVEKLPVKILYKSQLPEVKGEGGPFKIVDGLVIQQGPNYALAKRLQHWRAMLAKSKGTSVSSNVAPSTSTVSVVSNKQFAAAYGCMHVFKPMEIFFKETSNAVMGALLIHDIRNHNSVANPHFHIANPLELFKIGAFHGGIWRTGFHFGELGIVSAALFYAKQYGRPVGLAALAGLVAITSAIVANGPPHTW